MGSGQDIKQWLVEVKELGFDAVELSYKITDGQLKDAEDQLGKMKLKVSSIHNFCPTPSDGPSDRHLSNYYRLSSVDEHERQQAVKWTNIAVDTAQRMGAGVVVIHAGTCDFEDERSPRLFELYVNGQGNSDAFIKERARILTLRKEKRGPYIEALEKSLSEVMAYSRPKNITIGLETRYYPIEIPNFEEIGHFLGIYGKQGMGYWHDVGHAEINDRLGIKPHIEFLETFKEYLVGVHLHGIKGRRDHLAPFEGDMDLDRLLPHFGPRVLKIVESKPFASIDRIREAVTRLKNA
jgi:sugar phosphate isomerase/epimerase